MQSVYTKPNRCNVCHDCGPGMLNVKGSIRKESKYENTGFSMLHITECTCTFCGRKWED